jgi:hypothetical protein
MHFDHAGIEQHNIAATTTFGMVHGGVGQPTVRIEGLTVGGTA